jgi:hypothetical protein
MDKRIAVMALLLTGCVSSRPVTLPDGTQGISIRCPGAARDIADCMNEAARICGGPYHVYGSDQTDVGGAMAPAGNGAVFVRGIHRTMIVSCGAK